MKPQVRVITFDLWLTLIWDTKELEEYRKLRRLINFHRFVKRVGSPAFDYNSLRLAMEELRLRVKSIYEKGLDITPEERGSMLFEILGIKFSPKEAKLVSSQAGRIMSDSGYRKKYPRVNPEAEPALRELKEKYPEMKIGLVSNAARSSRTYARMLDSFGIGRYFDSLTISCEVGFLKPRKEIFEACLTELGAKPSESLHVGDLFRADVLGATSIGMGALLYTGLWHKYAQYMNPGEHIPHDFEPRHGVMVKEISSLREVVSILDGTRSVDDRHGERRADRGD